VTDRGVWLAERDFVKVTVTRVANKVILYQLSVIMQLLFVKSLTRCAAPCIKVLIVTGDHSAQLGMRVSEVPFLFC